MEKMPYRSELDVVPVTMPAQVVDRSVSDIVTTDWKTGLPVLTGAQVVLRELRASDATSLFALLTTEEVSRFISPPPTTVEGFERFIGWAHRQRRAGSYACFAVTLPLMGAGLVVLLWYAAFRWHRSGVVEWRGRSYRPDPEKG